MAYFLLLGYNKCPKDIYYNLIVLLYIEDNNCAPNSYKHEDM